MQRFAFNLLAGISMLTCIATTALWIRSYWVADFFLLQDQSHQIVLSRGGTQWQEGLLTDPFYSPMKRRDWHLSGARPVDDFSHFSWKSSHAAPGGVTTVTMPDKTFDADGGISGYNVGTTSFADFTLDYRQLTVPYWPVALATALLPLFAVTRRRRPAKGFCPKCGYDLRATPDRCPECGFCARVVS